MIKFEIKNKIKVGPGRAGIIKTAHGKIRTPAFITVGTAGMVKSLFLQIISITQIFAVLRKLNFPPQPLFYYCAGYLKKIYKRFFLAMALKILPKAGTYISRNHLIGRLFGM